MTQMVEKETKKGKVGGKMSQQTWDHYLLKYKWKEIRLDQQN